MSKPRFTKAHHDRIASVLRQAQLSCAGEDVLEANVGIHEVRTRLIALFEEDDGRFNSAAFMEQSWPKENVSEYPP